MSYAPAQSQEATPIRRPRETPRTFYRRLQLNGFNDAEAGNLTARAWKLRTGRKAWTLQEISRLLFLRWRVDQGRVPA